MALISKASLLMVPSTYEEGTLYNVLPSGNRAPDSTDQNSGYDQTRADFTFDRGSNAAATRIGSDGLIKKYRENLYTESNNFSDSDWSPKAGTFAKGVTDPNGGNEAWSWTATNTDPFLYQSKNFTGVHCLSIYVKGVGSTIGEDFQIRVASAIKDVTLTGDWQRVQHFGALNGSTNIGFEYGNPATPNDVVHIYAAQLETGLVATDYLDSGATTGKAGVLIDLPRINYDANGENGSLLLEPSRTQLFQYSEYYEASDWSKSALTIETNKDTSPEGVKNASKIYPSASSSLSYLYSVKSGVAATYTLSAYVKASGKNVVWLYINNGGANGTIYFDLSDQSKQVVDGSAQTPTGDIESLGNDWYKITFTTGGNIILNSGSGIGVSDAKGSTSVTKSGEDGALVYGMQIEAGSYVSSYIPNHGESGGVTRAADSCSVTGASDVIGQTEGVVYFEWDYQNVGSSGGNIIMSLAGASLQELYFWVKTDGTYVYDVYDSTKQAGITGSIGSFGIKKIALAYKNNDFALYINGVLAGSDTSGSVPTLTDLYIGRYAINTNYNISSGIKQATLFKERLSNAELATLTTL